MMQHLVRPGVDRNGESPTVFLLHGRGSDMHDLHSLAPSLPGDWNVVSVQAPFPGGPWGYGPGWAWYRYLADDRVVDETLHESLDAVEGFLSGVPDLAGGEPGPLVLGGFSQGGTVAMAYALTRPGTVPMVLNFSGFLVRAEGVEATRDRLAGLGIFWGHGTMDPAIPYALALRGRDQLQEAGAHLTTADHGGGHFIAPEELQAAVEWVKSWTRGSRGENPQSREADS